MGTGFFKPNVYTMVGQLYPATDTRRDSGFTLYMGINLGALFGPLVCAWFAANPRFGWSYGFAAAGVSMLIGLLFYLVTRGNSLRGIGAPPVPGRRSDAASDLASRLTSEDRRRILALAIVTVFVVFFWLAFEQVGSSLNVFAAHRIDPVAHGWLARVAPKGEIPAAWFQAVNPLFVLLLAPLMASLWQRLGSRAPSTPSRMALGLILLGVAYVVMVVGAARGDAGLRVSPLFLVGFYFVYSLGELCFLPAGFSFVGQTAPARLASMLMGIWFTANFVANLLGGYLAGMVERIERGEFFRVLGGQADFFLIFVISCLLAGGLLGALVPTIRRLTRSGSRPARYASAPAAPRLRSRR